MLSKEELEDLILPAAQVMCRTHRATAAHLARQLGITRRQATSLLSVLEKRELVARDAMGGKPLVRLHNVRLYLLKGVQSLDGERLVAFVRDAAAMKGYVTSEELCDWINAIKPVQAAKSEPVIETGCADIDNIVLEALGDAFGVQLDQLVRRLERNGIVVIREEEAQSFLENNQSGSNQ